MFKKIIIFKLFLLSLIIFIPFSAKAEPEVKAESVAVSAVVPSEVSAIKSHTTVSANETLADPVNHSVLLTIYLLDEDGNPLPDLVVRITSNRGSVDIIEAVNKIGSGDPNMNEDTTDANGRVSFRIGSWMSGDAILTITADNLIELPAQQVKFLPLPFPTDLTITIPIPFIEEEIVLLTPKTQEQELTPEQREAKRLVNTGTKVEIPFWIFMLIGIFILSIPILGIVSFIYLRRIRNAERREMALLQKLDGDLHNGHLSVQQNQPPANNNNPKPENNNNNSNTQQ